MRLEIIGGVCPICNGSVWYKPKRVMTKPVLAMVGDSMRLIHKECYKSQISKGEKEHEEERNDK